MKGEAVACCIDMGKVGIGMTVVVVVVVVGIVVFVIVVVGCDIVHGRPGFQHGGS